MKRVLLHILFWLLYFSINLYNELYLSSSFTAHPSASLLLDSALTQLLVLALKIPAVYYVLYSLIPRWIKADDWKMLALESVVAFIILVILYRILIQKVIWPYIYNEPPFEMTYRQLLARVFYSTLDLLQVIGIATAIKLFRLRIAAIKNEKMLVQERLQSEMLHLKSQVNPHFLFNSLNSIYSQARSKSDDTADTVMRLSKLLRYMLYENDKKTTTIGEELKVVDDYLELQQVRFGNKREVQFEKDIEDYSVAVPPLIILPLIENAYKHGHGEAVTIHCKIAVTKNSMQVKIVNPVAGDHKEGEGIGLSNISRQLQLMYRDYRFHHASRNNEFVVDLYINLASYAGTELFDSRR